MELSEWLKKKELSDSDLAKMLGHKRPDNVRRWRIGECIPRPHEMTKLLKVTKGQVTANDFYA